MVHADKFDTEVIAKLAQHIHDRYPDFSFRQLVETIIQQLVSEAQSVSSSYSLVTVGRSLRSGVQVAPLPWTAGSDSSRFSPSRRNQEQGDVSGTVSRHVLERYGIRGGSESFFKDNG